MTTKEIISALRNQGYKVKARQRTDGGWLITKINGKKYSAAEGNKRARDILGVTQTRTRMEQQQYNVQRYIRGKKKIKTLDAEMKKELRKVQREWRKHNVKARITSAHVKAHIKESGRIGALEYLKRRRRYGQGFAYEENVYAVTSYIQNLCKSLNSVDLIDQIEDLVNTMNESAGAIKFETLTKIHDMWYDLEKHGFDETMTRTALEKTYQLLAED